MIGRFGRRPVRFGWRRGGIRGRGYVVTRGMLGFVLIGIVPTTENHPRAGLRPAQRYGREIERDRQQDGHEHRRLRSG